MPLASPENPLLPATPGWDYGTVLPFARRQQAAEPVEGLDESGKSQQFTAPRTAFALPDVIRASINELTSAVTLPARSFMGQVKDMPTEAIEASLALLGAGAGASLLARETTAPVIRGLRGTPMTRPRTTHALEPVEGDPFVKAPAAAAEPALPAGISRNPGLDVFHGTLSGDVGQFRSGVHFGTIDAAHQRMMDLLALPDVRRPLGQPKVGKEAMTIYKSKINPKKVIDLPDLGDWHESNVAHALQTAGKWSKDQVEQAREGTLDPYEWLRKKGYDAIRYVNEHEAKGSQSYMVLDPKIITPTHRLDPVEHDPFVERRKPKARNAITIRDEHSAEMTDLYGQALKNVARKYGK